MDVFAFREELISECERFSRSLTRIRAAVINDDYYSRGDNWKSPPKGLNKKEL